MKKYTLTLLLLSIISVWPFFKNGFFESHDGEWMVIRFSAFHQTLVTGQFPVRFVDRLNNNYGYPVLNFLYPLPFYLAEVPKILGFGYINSIKIAFVAPTIVSALVMYWALLQLFGKKAAFAGAVVYLFTPYRFVDLYVRGSLGENLAFAIVPFIALSIFKIAKGNKLYFPVLAFSVFLLTISHNVIAALFLPFFYISTYFLEKKYWLKINFSFLLGIASSSFFTLPALYDLKFVRLSNIKVSQIPDHLVSVQKIFIPNWGFGPDPNSVSGVSTQIGIVTAVVAITALYLVFVRRQKDLFIKYQIALVIAIIFLMTKQSQFIWQNVPYIDVIQFPWRLLSLVTFIGAFLSAFLVNSVPKKSLLIALLVSASVLSSLPYIKPQNFTQKEEGFYSTNEDTTTVQSEYLPVWVKEQKPQRANEKIEIEDGAEIENLSIRPTVYKADIKLEKKSQITVNTIYFPGWQVKTNGEKIPIDYQNQFGLITFELPEGKSEVIIKYGKSPFHLITEFISLIGLLSIGVYFYILWRKRNS